MECWVKAILSFTPRATANPPQLLYHSASSPVKHQGYHFLCPSQHFFPFLFSVAVILLGVERCLIVTLCCVFIFVFEIGACCVIIGVLDHTIWPFWLTWRSLMTYDKHLCIFFSVILCLWRTFSSLFSRVQLICPTIIC